MFLKFSVFRKELFQRKCKKKAGRIRRIPRRDKERGLKNEIEEIIHKIILLSYKNVRLFKKYI